MANHKFYASVCLDFVRKQFLLKSIKSQTANLNSFSELEEAARLSPSGCNKLLFTPNIKGQTRSFKNQIFQGRFHNMQLHQTQNDFVRSVYEGVAYNSKKQIKTLESFVKKSFNKINFIGAGAESDLWCQIHADILECPIHKVKDPRLASAKGAAWLAFIGLEKITAEDIEDLVKIERIFHPIQQNAQVYRDGFSNFLDINQTHNKIYRNLQKNGIF